MEHRNLSIIMSFPWKLYKRLVIKRLNVKNPRKNTSFFMSNYKGSCVLSNLTVSIKPSDQY